VNVRAAFHVLNIVDFIGFCGTSTFPSHKRLLPFCDPPFPFLGKEFLSFWNVLVTPRLRKGEDRLASPREATQSGVVEDAMKLDSNSRLQINFCGTLSDPSLSSPLQIHGSLFWERSFFIFWSFYFLWRLSSETKTNFNSYKSIQIPFNSYNFAQILK
jgi:hypothetical protein